MNTRVKEFDVDGERMKFSEISGIVESTEEKRDPYTYGRGSGGLYAHANNGTGTAIGQYSSYTKTKIIVSRDIFIETEDGQENVRVQTQSTY